MLGIGDSEEDHFRQSQELVSRVRRPVVEPVVVEQAREGGQWNVMLQKWSVYYLWKAVQISERSCLDRMPQTELLLEEADDARMWDICCSGSIALQCLLIWARSVFGLGPPALALRSALDRRRILHPLHHFENQSPHQELGWLD